jgi:hypothetical protein
VLSDGCSRQGGEDTKSKKSEQQEDYSKAKEQETETTIPVISLGGV